MKFNQYNKDKYKLKFIIFVNLYNKILFIIHYVIIIHMFFSSKYNYSSQIFSNQYLLTNLHIFSKKNRGIFT